MEQEDIVAQSEEMLNKLTRAELVALNRAIVRRIKVMDDFARFKANAAFYPGDRVSWKDKQGFEHRGWVTRVNTKTISVEDEDDPEGIWRVSATLLTKLQ
jgi:hypothetical protein